MRNSVKREAESTRDRSRKREADESSSERPKIVKKEKESKSVIASVRSQEPPIQEEEEQDIADRRAIRSQYLALTHKINGTVASFVYIVYFRVCVLFLT